MNGADQQDERSRQRVAVFTLGVGGIAVTFAMWMSALMLLELAVVSLAESSASDMGYFPTFMREWRR